MEGWIGLVIAIFLGALIGLQREYIQQREHIKNFAGFRTLILVSFFGAILGYLTKSFLSLWVIIGFIAVLVLVESSYIIEFLKFKKVSGTTEIASIFVYVIGVMCTTGNLKLAVVLGIVIAAILAFKDKMHGLIKGMEKNEIMAVIKFSLISFVVLPFLPNKNYSPMDVPGLGEVLSGIGISSSFLSQLNVFNFYNIWLMVIFVAGIGFIGYFLTKYIGQKRGYGLIGFIGGLVSSTAVTLSMAEDSKKSKGVVSPFVLATIIATSVMFVRIIFEVAVVNNILLPSVIAPMGVMALMGFSSAFIFSKRHNKKANIEKVNLKQPFALGPALKFGFLFIAVIFVSKVAQVLFGSAGIYTTSVLSGLIDVDAIVLTMSSLSKSGEISNSVATTAIILAAASNTLVKGSMAYFLGNKKFGKIVLGVFLLILVVGALVLFL